MIHHITGKLVEKSPIHAVIETAGIGYFINISLNTFSKLGSSESCKLFTHLSVKEDSHTLFGFFEVEEREVFRKLISVSGVGASTARVMLSSLTAKEVAVAITSSNVPALKAIKGIGAKTAERIIIDLKDKLGGELGYGTETFAEVNTNHQEAISALLALGFAKNAVDKTIQKILAKQQDLSVEGLIKEALKLL